MKKIRSGKKGARLGQHFLTGTWAAKKLAEAISVRAGETILEIGPGTGALTRELLKTRAPVIAVEKDEALVDTLNETFVDEMASDQLTVIGADVRDFDDSHAKLGRYVVAANIPYYITGEIIRKFLAAKQQPRAMALLVQKEVAERIVARNSKESILSLSVKAFGEPKIVAKVSKGNFSPPPSVDSAILLIENISRRKNFDEKKFFDLLHAGFGSKRKQLAGNLKKKYGATAAEALAKVGVSEKARAEDVTLEKWLELSKTLAGHK